MGFIPSGESSSVHTLLIFMDFNLDLMAPSHFSELDHCIAFTLMGSKFDLIKSGSVGLPDYVGSFSTSQTFKFNLIGISSFSKELLSKRNDLLLMSILCSSA